MDNDNDDSLGLAASISASYNAASSWKVDKFMNGRPEASTLQKGMEVLYRSHGSGRLLMQSTIWSLGRVGTVQHFRPWDLWTLPMGVLTLT